MWYKVSKIDKEKEMEKKKEMEDWFKKRTDKHVKLVKKYAEKIEKAFPELEGLVEQTKTHDDSKYKEPEKTPYIYISWQYHINYPSPKGKGF